MAQKKITKASVDKAIRDAITDQRKIYLWDTELKGFGFYASPKGAASWLFQHWVGGLGGKPKRMVFNDYPALSVEDARTQAERLRADVNNGVDILTRKERLRQDAREKIQAPTLGDAIATYIKLNREPGRYWTELEATFERDVIPALGRDTIVASITDTELQHLLDAKRAKHPGAARTLFAANLRPFFNWCVKRKLVPSSPAEKIDAPKNVEKRDRVLSEAEVRAFWLATTSLDSMYGAFHRLLLLTAQRREEVAGMRWPELDVERVRG